MTAPPPSPPSPPSPPDGADAPGAGHSDGRRPMGGSMSLLQQLMDRPLDPSYAAAAARRDTEGLPPSTSLRSPWVLVAAIVIGFLFVVAAFALRPAGTTASRDKERLIEQIEARQSRGDELAGEVSKLGQQIQDAQSAALASQASQLSAELSRLRLLTGEVAVTGPGLVLTVDDAPDARAKATGGDPRDAGGFPQGRVTSFDLQILVNGIWQAGAEAIAINGQRLTSRSSIRFAGDAILVDYRPLTPPYVITAIGDGRELQTRFASSASGAYLKSLGDNYAIPSTVTTPSLVDIPRSPSLPLTFARPGSAGAASSPSSPSSPSSSSPSSAPRGGTTPSTEATRS
jgi:uncharacterized protein YlxW (UPF0749 family)